MKPAERKPEEVYRIIDRETDSAQGSYSRAYKIFKKKVHPFRARE